MNRDCKDTKEIKWFELPNHFVFHFVNAWEKKAANGDNLVIMFGCALKDVNLEYKCTEEDGSEHPFLWEDNQNDNRGKLTKFTFNMTTGESEMKLLVDEASDFPLIDMDIVGYES
jgi:carotenoid cleavage dioxygenase